MNDDLGAVAGSVRICHVAYTHYETDPRVKREAEALAAAGYEVDCVTLKEAGYATRRRANGVNIVALSPSRYRGGRTGTYVVSYLTFFINVFLYLALRPFRYRVLHFHTMPDFIVFSGFIPRLCGCRVVIDFHDVMHSLYESRFGPGAVIAMVKLQTRLAAAFAHSAVTVNTACRDIYAGLGVRAEKVTLVYNFPDERLFRPRKAVRDPLQFRIVCHGTVMERLGFDTLVKAVARIRADIPGIRLVIIGKGDYEPAVRALIAETGIDGITEYPEEKLTVDEVPDALAGCDLGIVPTKIGPGTDIMLPLKLLEYVAMNVPALSTPLPAVKELCDDGTVLFFRSGDADDLGEKILDFYRQRDTLEPEMRKRMRAFRERSNWRNESGKLTALYASLLNGKDGNDGATD